MAGEAALVLAALGKALNGVARVVAACDRAHARAQGEKEKRRLENMRLRLVELKGGWNTLYKALCGNIAYPLPAWLENDNTVWWAMFTHLTKFRAIADSTELPDRRTVKKLHKQMLGTGRTLHWRKYKKQPTMKRVGWFFYIFGFGVETDDRRNRAYASVRRIPPRTLEHQRIADKALDTWKGLLADDDAGDASVGAARVDPRVLLLTDADAGVGGGADDDDDDAAGAGADARARGASDRGSARRGEHSRRRQGQAAAGSAKTAPRGAKGKESISDS